MTRRRTNRKLRRFNRKLGRAYIRENMFGSYRPGLHLVGAYGARAWIDWARNMVSRVKAERDALAMDWIAPQPPEMARPLI